MTCEIPKPVYRPHSQGGLNLAASESDGYAIALRWDRAYPSTSDYSLMYNIYFSSVLEDVFTEGVKYVAQDDGYWNASIIDLTPGDTYYFAVKASQYDPSWWNTALFPDGPPDLKLLAEGLLLSDIDDETLTIPVSDVNLFPTYGVIQIGTELIRYISKDIPTSSLIALERGWMNTNARLHQTDGYDGYVYQDPIVRFWKGFEDDNRKVFQETVHFAFPNPAFTALDGYATKTDKLTLDDGPSNEDLEDTPRYDGVGWHRTRMSDIVDGTCVGTYIGGEQFCADGYLGVGRQLRGIPLNEQAMRREEMLLEEGSGEKVVLVKRLWEGIRCPCILSTNEHPEKRCIKCYGTGFLTGYEQFFNPRRSDGRILVQFGPATEDIKFENGGLESYIVYESWTLPFPMIKDRDFVIRYDIDGNEEYRYEVLDVTRNTNFGSNQGVQKFKLQRVRKTSPIYMWKSIADTSTLPTTVTTSIGMMPGPGGTTLPHTHEIVVNEDVVALSQVNQTTSVSEGHNHEVRNGVVQEQLGHTHTIIIP
jgi:hypothetical protein